MLRIRCLWAMHAWYFCDHACTLLKTQHVIWIYIQALMEWVYSLFRSALMFEADDRNPLNQCLFFLWKSVFKSFAVYCSYVIVSCKSPFFFFSMWIFFSLLALQQNEKRKHWNKIKSKDMKWKGRWTNVLCYKGSWILVDQVFCVFIIDNVTDGLSLPLKSWICPQ